MHVHAKVHAFIAVPGKPARRRARPDGGGGLGGVLRQVCRKSTVQELGATGESPVHSAHVAPRRRGAGARGVMQVERGPPPAPKPAPLPPPPPPPPTAPLPFPPTNNGNPYGVWTKYGSVGDPTPVGLPAVPRLHFST